MLETAKKYLSCGLSVLPAIKEQKRPCIGSWKEYQNRLPTAGELAVWFSDERNSICVVTGKVSGNLEIIDFDNGGQQYPAWKKLIPFDLFDKLVIEQTPSGGFHAIYRCESEVDGNLKLAKRKLDDGKIITLIETRGEGGLFLCAPTDGYTFIHRDFSGLKVLTEEEREILITAAWSLNEYTPEVQADPVGAVDKNPQPRFTDGKRPGEDFNERGDIRDVLKLAGWTYVNTSDDNERWRRPGKKAGWSATLQKSTNTFYVFSSNAMPFESQKAFSPFAVFAMLECNGDFGEAASLLSDHGYGDKGILLPPEEFPGVDISGYLKKLEVIDVVKEDTFDPGYIPAERMRIPGFISELMDFCLESAPYPNQGLAFCGALAMQSYLCGQKIRDAGNLRTNLYLLALAGSASGKDWPRQINSHIMFMMGKSHCLGDKFASGEGIQDALYKSPSMLFQNDEIDGLLRMMKRPDGNLESTMTTLLTMYTSSGGIYPMRVKAGKEEVGVINQPHLTMFGTATPKYYYEALDERMLTNGLFARMIVVDIGSRGDGQEPGLIDAMPQRIIETAQEWNMYRPKNEGTLGDFYPVPDVVEATGKAKSHLMDFRVFADSEYRKAESRCDEAAKAIWGRANEQARKMSLLFAGSESFKKPEISKKGAEFATDFIDHQTRRMLYLADTHAAADDFDGMCKKVISKLQTCPDKQLSHSPLLKHTRWDAKRFKTVIETLMERRDIELVPVETVTKNGRIYKLR